MHVYKKRKSDKKKKKKKKREEEFEIEPSCRPLALRCTDFYLGDPCLTLVIAPDTPTAHF